MAATQPFNTTLASGLSIFPNALLDSTYLTAFKYIDPNFKFSLKPYESTETLPSDSGLLAITKAMFSVARCDYEGTMNAGTFVHKLSPAVSVSIVLPVHISQIQTRFAAWGMDLASHFITQNAANIRDFTFIMEYHDANVGNITFAKTKVQLSLAGSADDSDAENQTLIPDIESIARTSTSQSLVSGYATLAPSLSDEEVTFNYTVIHEPFTKLELYDSITNLAYLAQSQPNRLLQSYYLSSKLHGTSKLESTGITSKSPLMRNNHALPAWITIAWVVVDKDIFYWFDVSIIVIEVTIGKGFIMMD